MDYKIKFGLICVVALFMVCRNVTADTNDTTNATTDAVSSGGPVSPITAELGVTVAGGGKVTVAGPVVTTASPPAPIKCKLGTCNDTTSCAALKTTCDSDTSLGCQITTDTNGDHTFSCVASGGTCKADDKTKCCAVENCNPFEKSSASKIIGNLVSALLMMVLIKFL